jgi:hypothetical protein
MLFHYRYWMITFLVILSHQKKSLLYRSCQVNPCIVLLQFVWKLAYCEFLAKNITIFYPGHKSSHKKLQRYQLFDFPRFLHHTFFDNSTSYCCRNLCLGALERYFIEQNMRKIKKKTTITFFFKKILVSMTWRGITQNANFLKI